MRGGVSSPELAKRDVMLRGLRVHYAEAGSGPALLLIHGFLVSHREWLPVLPHLTGTFRCILPDLPGFGGSDKRAPGDYPYTREAFAETIADLMTALDLPRAHVCGHSMGGSIAITLAADHPERVQRLVLIDSASYPFSIPLKGKIPLLPVIGPLLFKRLYGRGLFHDYFQNDVWSGHPGVDRAQVDAYYDDFDSPEAREAGYAVLQRTVDLGALGPKIGRVRAPTLIIWGDEDRIFPLGLGHRLVKDIAGARLRIVDTCGHAPNEEKPEETARMITAHLLGTED
jgi:pimeloyl-ACP methyl ester carboxylesterase